MLLGLKTNKLGGGAESVPPPQVQRVFKSQGKIGLRLHLRRDFYTSASAHHFDPSELSCTTGITSFPLGSQFFMEISQPTKVFFFSCFSP